MGGGVAVDKSIGWEEDEDNVDVALFLNNLLLQKRLLMELTVEDDVDVLSWLKMPSSPD